ncbi:MAG: hypothetical protein M1813_009798, partial [Trichoglossum hirsutum]
SSRCREALRWLVRRPNVSSTPPSTQPAAPSKGHTRKPSAKVLEAQRSLRTPIVATRPTQNEQPTATYEHEDRDTSLEEVASLITNLKKTITQQMSIVANQNNVINSLRADLTEIKSEQQSLKT